MEAVACLGCRKGVGQGEGQAQSPMLPCRGAMEKYVEKNLSKGGMVFHKIILFYYTYFEVNILTGELLLKSITCLHRYILKLVSRIDDDELCAMRECVEIQCSISLKIITAMEATVQKIFVLTSVDSAIILVSQRNYLNVDSAIILVLTVLLS